jgi:hypothetical protein
MTDEIVEVVEVVAIAGVALLGSYAVYRYVSGRSSRVPSSGSGTVHKAGVAAQKYASKAYHGAKKVGAAGIRAAKSAYASVRKPATNPQFIVAKNGKTYLVSRRQK